MRPINILHHVPLSSRQWGGVEVQFAHLLAATRDDPRLRNFLSLDDRAVPRQYEEIQRNLAAEGHRYRRWGALTLPKPLRVPIEARQARRWAVDVVLNTNQFGDVRAAQVARLARCAAVYWERGAAWFPREKPLTQRFTDGHSLFMSNSLASARMLREVWKVERPIEVCAPCVWTADGATAGPPRTLPQDRPLVLGFAARLRAFKGGVLAVHALAELRRRGLEARLVMAGDGAGRTAIGEQACRLGVEEAVSCLGHVDDMAAFYDGIDVLLHPALREPYGNVCAEAALHGVPAVATRVDGLPEVVADGVSGLCVTPTLPLSDYPSFGGDRSDVYPVVYRPETGHVGEAGLPDPQALADAVVTLAAEPGRYADFSANARADALERHGSRRFIERFIQLMTKASGNGA